MKSSKQYCYITVLSVSLGLFSSHSSAYNTSSQEPLTIKQAHTEKTQHNIDKSFSIHNLIHTYNPLRFLTSNHQHNTPYKTKHSISFDKRVTNPVSYDLKDSSMEDKHIQLNITVRF